MANLNGEGVITGLPVYKGRIAAITYAETPVFDVPLEEGRGKQYHIGEGVWRKVCRECNAYVDNYNAIQWLPELAHHEHDVHGLDVVGVNVAMLPKGL